MEWHLFRTAPSVVVIDTESGSGGWSMPMKDACAKSPLRQYFQQQYLEGAEYEGGEYSQSSWEATSRVRFLQHRPTGIKVWEHALDLRSPDTQEPFNVLFHYTSARGVSNMVKLVKRDMQGLTGLLQQNDEFGPGIYTSHSDPGSFGSKDAVIWNKCWPAKGDAGARYPEAVSKALKACPHRAAGPADARNEELCAAILKASEAQADFCIPMLVPHRTVFDVQRRATPELLASGISAACNRWGERQWPQRDVCVVQLGDVGLRQLAKTCVESQVRIEERRLQRVEQTKGKDHPDTMKALNLLATLLQAMGRIENAEPLHRRAFESLERKLGKEHPSTLTSLNNLAVLMLDMGRPDTAEELHRRCLEARLKVLGEGHADTQNSMQNLATLLKNTGRPLDAEPMQRKLVALREKHLGREHNATLVAVGHLADVCEATEQLKEAESLRRRLYVTRESKLGANQPATLESAANLSALLARMGKHQEAEGYKRLEVEGKEKSYGRGHPAAIGAEVGLAALLKETGRPEAAEQVARRACESVKKSQGVAEVANPSMLQALEELQDMLKGMDRALEAAELEREAAVMRKAQQEVDVDVDADTGSVMSAASVKSIDW